MRFDEWAEKLFLADEAVREAVDRQNDLARPSREAEKVIQSEAERRYTDYKLGTLHVYGGGNRRHGVKIGVQLDHPKKGTIFYTDATVEELLFLVEVRATIDLWRAGDLSELPPSGSWTEARPPQLTHRGAVSTCRYDEARERSRMSGK